jgi:hypothetical protein
MDASSTEDNMQPTLLSPEPYDANRKGYLVVLGEGKVRLEGPPQAAGGEAHSTCLGTAHLASTVYTKVQQTEIAHVIC